MVSLEQLSLNQKFVSMALTEDWKSAQDIMRQATNDGASGSRNYGLDMYEPILRVQWRKLVRLEIAARHPEKKAFRRGVKWDEFQRNYGGEPTNEGCENFDTEKLIEEIFDKSKNT